MSHLPMTTTTTTTATALDSHSKSLFEDRKDDSNSKMIVQSLQEKEVEKNARVINQNGSDLNTSSNSNHAIVGGLLSLKNSGTGDVSTDLAPELLSEKNRNDPTSVVNWTSSETKNDNTTSNENDGNTEIRASDRKDGPGLNSNTLVVSASAVSRISMSPRDSQTSHDKDTVAVSDTRELEKVLHPSSNQVPATTQSEKSLETSATAPVLNHQQPQGHHPPSNYHHHQHSYHPSQCPPHYSSHHQPPPPHHHHSATAGHYATHTPTSHSYHPPHHTVSSPSPHYSKQVYPSTRYTSPPPPQSHVHHSPPPHHQNQHQHQHQHQPHHSHAHAHPPSTNAYAASPPRYHHHHTYSYPHAPLSSSPPSYYSSHSHPHYHGSPYHPPPYANAHSHAHHSHTR